MAGSTTTTVLVCFEMDGVPLEMWGPARVKEIFGPGMDKLALFNTMENVLRPVWSL